MPASSLRYVQQVIFRVLAVLSILNVFSMLLDIIRFPVFERITYVYFLSAVLYLVWVFIRLRLSRWQFLQVLVDLPIVLLIGITLVPIGVLSGMISVRILMQVGSRFIRRVGDTYFFGSVRMTPSRVLLSSFAGVILIGTMFLMHPSATVDHQGASFINALFTAASATCVTGLAVVDTGTYFTLFGQLVILLLIQIGGLGIITFSTFFILLIWRKVGLRAEETVRDILGGQSRVDVSRLIIDIIRIALFIELIGAAILFARFLPDYGFAQAFFSAVFHSISAFCNAGFSLYPDSITRYAGDLTVNMVIMFLVITGGLGFFVLNELIEKTKNGNPFSIRWGTLTVHTRLVLVSSFLLVSGGALLFFFFEFDNAMLHLSTGDKLLASFFQSVVTRTAGFNTIDVAEMRPVMLFITMILMLIGASPASTGGGIKTTTFAVLVLSIKSMFQAGDRVEIYDRTIPTRIVLQSISIFMFVLTFLIVFTILLLATQAAPFLDIMFEAASALGTVGLSTGVTPTLNGIGKLLIVILMYVGRVGPVTVALAIREGKKVKVTYPETRIGVG